MLDDPGSRRLKKDTAGNVVKDNESQDQLCKCGHPVFLHPPGSASTQRQATEVTEVTEVKGERFEVGHEGSCLVHKIELDKRSLS